MAALTRNMGCRRLKVAMWNMIEKLLQRKSQDSSFRWMQASSGQFLVSLPTRQGGKDTTKARRSSESAENLTSNGRLAFSGSLVTFALHHIGPIAVKIYTYFFLYNRGKRRKGYSFVHLFQHFG